MSHTGARCGTDDIWRVGAVSVVRGTVIVRWILPTRRDVYFQRVRKSFVFFVSCGYAGVTIVSWKQWGLDRALVPVVIAVRRVSFRRSIERWLFVFFENVYDIEGFALYTRIGNVAQTCGIVLFWFGRQFDVGRAKRVGDGCGPHFAFRLEDIVPGIILRYLAIFIITINSFCQKSSLASQKTTVLKHFGTFSMQCPIISFSSVLGRLGNFYETIIERQIVPKRILPASIVLSVKRKIVHDELVDLRQGHHFRRRTVDGHSAQSNITVRAVCHLRMYFFWVEAFCLQMDQIQDRQFLSNQVREGKYQLCRRTDIARAFEAERLIAKRSPANCPLAVCLALLTRTGAQSR